MKKTDLSPARQKLLVPVATHPGAFALVPPLAPRYLSLGSVQKQVTRAHETLGALQLMTARLPNPNLVTRTFDRREAVRSSQIEGTNSGIHDLFLYEATGSALGLPPDVRVTLNYVTALEYGLQEITGRGAKALNCRLVKELHKQLMIAVDDFSGTPGEFREIQNWIGGLKIYQARFVPPPHEKIKECMADLETLLQYFPAVEDQFEMPIVVRMAIVHAQFETIHPFIDGNGRVGRLLLPLMLAAAGYPPVYLAGFLKQHQREYYDCLAGVQLKDKWAEWVGFFAEGVQVAAQESMETAQQLETILARWTGRLTELKFRTDSAVRRLPEILIGTPIITVRQAMSALGVSFPAASAALAAMENEGMLVQPVKQQRNRTYVAKEVIALLDRSA